MAKLTSVQKAAKNKTPLQNAIFELLTNEPNGSGSATAEQIKEVAEKFELWGGPAELEGMYLDAVDRLANE